MRVGLPDGGLERTRQIGLLGDAGRHLIDDRLIGSLDV